MKVYIALPVQMAEQGSGKGMVNTILMHASWKYSWEDHTSWCGNFKFEPVISLDHRSRQRYWGYGSSIHRPSSETPRGAIFCTLSELHFPAWQRPCSIYKSHKRFSSDNNI